LKVKRAVCIGSGGHAAVVIEALTLSGGVELVGALDNDPSRVGASVLGIGVLGGDDLLGKLRGDGVTLAVMGIGSGSSCAARGAAFERLIEKGFSLIDVIHPRSYLSASATHGEGLVMLPNSLIHTNARLGRNVLVNSGACVEHECVIGDSVHIATGAILSGGVQIGTRTHVGAGAIVRQGIRIGSDVVVGAGAVVVRDVDNGTVVFGNPAKPSIRAEISTE
jgi:UDP-perosamine 4-acetyltransferase